MSRNLCGGSHHLHLLSVKKTTSISPANSGVADISRTCQPHLLRTSSVEFEWPSQAGGNHSTVHPLRFQLMKCSAQTFSTFLQR